jgi:AcrR family transcriptional regulator
MNLMPWLYQKTAMTKIRNPTSTAIDTRQRLIDAAFGIAIESGPNAITLDAVAERAGTSKGGLLYHFKTKDALFEELVEFAICKFQERVDGAHLTAGQGSSASAYVLASTDPFAPEDVLWRTGLLALIFYQPRLTEIWRTRMEQWTSVDRREGMDPNAAVIARLAADGMWFRSLLNASPVNDSTLPEIRALLLTLASKRAS